MEEEYVPINLWIKQNQMDKIAAQASKESTTVYSLIRKIIDFYYENRTLNEEL